MTEKLYIIMRTDMDSMSVGRIAAQASHAANQFVYDLERKGNSNDALMKRYIAWKNQTLGGFGTVIVLDGYSQELIEDLLYRLEEGNLEQQFFSSVVIDPEYGVRDGDFVHMVENVMTCAYVFPITDDVGDLQELSLL
jgi:peptidyl-tRNA hydrolase